LDVEIGRLNYSAGPKLSTAFILGIVLGLAVPLIIAIIVFLYLRRRHRRKNRNKVVMPPPNSVPNNYAQNRSSNSDCVDGAFAEEAIPLKSQDPDMNLDDAPIGELKS
jgi:hypothetical protein